MKTGIIDRFEGKWAVIEFGDTMKDILRSELPNDIQVGDVLNFKGGQVTIDRNKTKQLEKEIEELMSELFEDE